jgi:hypothetical protein
MRFSDEDAFRQACLGRTYAAVSLGRITRK